MVSYSDAYDDYGYLRGVPGGVNISAGTYGTGFNGLTGLRQTELYVNNTALPQNTIRWFDSFMNETGSAVTVNLAFGRNLGSDDDTVVEGEGTGWLVTSDGGTDGDFVILHVFGNGEGTKPTVVDITGGGFGDGSNYIHFVYQDLDVAPGETVSLLHLHQLFADEMGFDASVAAALTAGPLFINDAVFAGLSADQVSSIVNFGVAGTDPTLTPGDGASGSGIAVAPLGFPVALATSQVTKDLLLLDLGTAVGSSTARMSSGGILSPKASIVRPTPSAFTGFLIAGVQGGKVDDIDYDSRYAGAGTGGTSAAFDYGLAVTRGYADADNGVDVDGDGHTVSLYAGYDEGAGMIGRVALTFGGYVLSTAREAGTLVAFGDTQPDALSVGAMLGYRMARGDLALLPYISGVHTRVDVDGFEESGAAQANLVVEDANLRSTLYEVGMRARRNFRATSLFGDLAYVYTDGDQAEVATRFTTGTLVSS